VDTFYPIVIVIVLVLVIVVLVLLSSMCPRCHALFSKNEISRRSIGKNKRFHDLVRVKYWCKRCGHQWHIDQEED
jgi:RNase P subunit RPR2